ncbi:hypothetical protein ACFL5G_01005 [Candidatus Margulisiibacteriota bacterium]
MRKLALVIIFIFITSNLYALDISHDGRVVKVQSGESAVKYISLLNREEKPNWVRVVSRSSGPVFNFKDILSRSALGWTLVQKGWLKVEQSKLKKLRVEFLPPSKTKKGKYKVWLLLEQQNTPPKVLGEEQRGRSLQAETIETYYLPLVVQVD